MTGSWLTKWEPNRIICWIEDYNCNPESPMNPNSNSEIQVTLLPSHNGNRQSIWWRSHRRSNELSNGEIAALPWHPPRNRQRWLCRPTFYWSHLWRSLTHEVDWIVTEVDFERQLQSQATSLSQCRLLLATKRDIIHQALHEGLAECKFTWTC